MKKLGFGFMRLPLLDGNDQTSFDKKQICEMVDTFIEKGFTYFDTAYVYHNGVSESLLKEVLVERYPRDKFLLATKLPTFSLKEKADVKRIFEEQLEKCGVEYFDYYLLHCLNKDNFATCNRLDAFDFVVEQKKLGKIKKVGFSFHDSAEMLDEILTAHPEMEFVQLQINYLDWESYNVQSRKCYEVAVKHGKEIIVMEPVKGGALANVPAKAEELMKSSNSELSVASWAIRFAASLDNVIVVLSGMSNSCQLNDNVSYMEDFIPLTVDENKMCFEIAEIINNKDVISCTACRYCVEGCPMNISIPEIFALKNRKVKNEISEEDFKSSYENMDGGKAGDCIGCGQCEEHCPQHLDIINILKTITE